ncbi:hypothetical protein DXZ79_05860 [Yersinia rochesterensis]|uniref:Uncharacterized protein n=1 Tax=Yersinia rochesterensis TaxID=1604335 RepID=A0A8D4N084_9GAMM|nr:hypothetical protein DXZ79_05860 [Yersinia rochesterensis]
MELQVGSQQANPDELTLVSDSGECAQLTTLRLQERRVFRRFLLACCNHLSSSLANCWRSR